MRLKFHNFKKLCDIVPSNVIVDYVTGDVKALSTGSGRIFYHLPYHIQGELNQFLFNLIWNEKT